VAHSIVVQNLSKQYQLGVDRADLFYERLVNWVKSPLQRRQASASNQSIWAVRDVSLEVDEGEVLGVARLRF